MASERLQRRIERLLDQIDEAEAQEKWESVRNLALDVLEVNSENPEAIAYLSAAERRLDLVVVTTSDPTPSAPVRSEQEKAVPSSFANGRYQVRRFLGEGGKKQVYLAQDTVLDREVAFALIKTEGLDEAGRTRISREAQAMGRLGSHPQIVTVFDLGEEPSTITGQGQPYMVTELMAGGDVEDLIEDATDHRLSLDRAIKIARETCQGLEFAHSRGIVHRDLKPGNVWLTENGVAKIGDFGLAVSLDRSRLTQEGMMVGTVSYMPPEQAMGGEVTPRSDLYSLGAMLYEMVTGRPPFLGDDAVAIIGQHINTPPVSPTWHNAQCPRPLEALIMRLLAKNPSERPQSASDVLSALEAVDLGTSVEQPAAGVDEGHALDSLAGGVFVGRQREMGELKACLEDALSGRGRLVTLVGEPGIGKTRTALELATYAGLRQAQVLWGRCYEGEGAPPYWPWVQAIRSYVRDVNPEQLRSDMGAGAANIAEVVSDVRERLPHLGTPSQLEPDQARFRLFDSISAFLKNAGNRQPLVLVLDDLHWADQPSLLLLEFVSRELANSRVLLIGTYRDVEVSRRHPLSKTLAELNRERLFQRVLLRGLDQEDVGRFIELVSGVNPPAGMLEAVHKQTEGNPLFVTEVVRLLVQEGELTQEKANQRDSWSVRIPEGVREVIGRRLDRLSERCNETLTIASVVGREFTLEQLSPLIEDISGDRLLDVLEEALASRVIEELPQSVGRYQFTHALIQETLAEELSTTRKVRLHARIAQALEELYGDNANAHAAELAHHYAEAQTVQGTDKLAHYSLLAGERALAAYAYEEALAHFNRGLATKSDEPMDLETAHLLHGLGTAQAATLPLHHIGEAVASLKRAFDYYVDSADVERAVAVAETFLPQSSDGLTEMVQIVARALALAPPNSVEAGRLYAIYGVLMSTEGAGHDTTSVLSSAEGASHNRAREALSRALSIAQRVGDLDLQTRSLLSSAEVAIYGSRFQAALEFSLLAVSLAERTADPRTVMLANFWTSYSLINLGEFERASQYAGATLAPAEELRHHTYVARANLVNHILHRLKGEWEAARKFSDRGLASSPADYPLLVNRVLLEHELGANEQGEAYLQRLQEITLAATSGANLGYGSSIVIPLIAHIKSDNSRLADADAAIEAVLSSKSANPFATAFVRISMAMLAVQRNDAAKARENHRVIAQAGGAALSFIISGGRLKGLLAQTMGEMDQAAEDFEDALTFSRDRELRPELAWSCCDYAACLLQRDADGDRAKANALLDESLAISSELSMRPLLERVLSRREILGA